MDIWAEMGLPYDNHGVLNSILDYLYDTLPADDIVQLDARRLCLAVLGEVRRGTEKPLGAACYKIFGCGLEKHRERRTATRALLDAEFRDVSSQRAAQALSDSSVVPENSTQPDAGIHSPQDGNVASGCQRWRRNVFRHFVAC